jgi:two-component system nitrogen regulation response regulator NtrX
VLILASGDPAEPITADMIPPEQEMRADTGSGLAAERIIALPLREAREVFERDYLYAQMLRFSGNISRTAAFIGMERSALHRKLKSLGLSGGRSVTEGGVG